MKVALSSSGNTLESPLDSRFGRAPFFVIMDTETNDFQVIDNSQNLNATQGAGVQSSQTVINAGVDALITGHVGPNAFMILQQAGIKIYQSDATSVQQALEQLNAGSLKEAQSADVRGHWK